MFRSEQLYKFRYRKIHVYVMLNYLWAIKIKPFWTRLEPSYTPNLAILLVNIDSPE